jgi:hypothetical protein
VAYVLEREREKAIGNYEKVMSEKGTGGVIDGDFDDLQGEL